MAASLSIASLTTLPWAGSLQDAIDRNLTVALGTPKRLCMVVSFLPIRGENGKMYQGQAISPCNPHPCEFESTIQTKDGRLGKLTLDFGSHLLVLKPLVQTDRQGPIAKYKYWIDHAFACAFPDRPKKPPKTGFVYATDVTLKKYIDSKWPK